MPGAPELHGIVVPGEGPDCPKYAVIGERPGESEAWKRRPFVGATGQAQDRHLERGGLNRRDGYFDNLVRTYDKDNTAPSPEETIRWGPTLLETLRRLRPRFIISAGAHSTRWFLGESAFLEAVHGIPHEWSDGNGYRATVIPCYHPAAPFHQPNLLQFVVYDYQRACDTIRGQLRFNPPKDTFAGRERYWDLDEGNADWYLGEIGHCRAVGIDTEGTPGAEWSLQVCTGPGTGLVLRKSHRDFPRVVRLLARKIRKHKPTLVGHAWLYDIEMGQGLDLDVLHLLDSGSPIFDTMMAAYLLCIEPQSLKMLSRRHCGMVMNEYSEVVGQAGLEKQLAYLEEVRTGKWPKPEGRIERENDGITRLYTPQPLERRAESILLDYYSGKTDQNGNGVDPLKRWRKVDRELRRMAERRLGPMPIGTLADVDLDSAIRYAGRDPDATLRLYPILSSLLEAQGSTSLMKMKMAMLPVAASIKINGIRGRRESFEQLSEAMWEQMDLIRGKIQRQYMGGRSFNPASGPQTEVLLRRRGLQGEKKTKTKRMSTSKKSIEHLRFVDPAIELLEQWREHQKVKDSFADPVLENWPDLDPPPESVRVKCDLKITRVSSGRFSAALLDGVPSAPLLAIPVRNELGKRVRDCYEAAPGYILGSFDLDQAEMRIMADESGDESLIRIFREGKIDVHSDTASRVFHIPYDKLEADKATRKKLRDPAKRANFGVITGIQGPGLYDQLRMAGATGWSVEKCSQLIDDVLELRSGVKQYMLDCRRDCRKNSGIIRDRWGMPRYLPAILDDRKEAKYDRLEAERQTHSHRIQGGAQGWIQNAMGWLWKELRPYGDAVRFILQVHDELLVEAVQGLEEEIGEILVEGLVNHGGAKLKVPMRSSGSWALTWGKLK